jgi:hypothetical protein
MAHTGSHVNNFVRNAVARAHADVEVLAGAVGPNIDPGAAPVALGHSAEAQPRPHTPKLVAKQLDVHSHSF